jgi:DNA-binding GntR family transcriptional regulator
MDDPATDVFRLESLDRPVSLGEKAYRSLKDAIIRGAFRPGHKFTVRSVADALGVSSTPARDGINRLIAEGALINLGPKTVVVPALTMEVLDEITTLRLTLEALASEKGTPNIAKQEVKRLQAVQKELNKALDTADYTRALDLNKDFHFTVYEAAGLPRLTAMIESLWVRIGPSLNMLYPDFAITRKGANNHEWILRCLDQGDAAGVKAGFERDIRDGYRNLHAFVADSLARQRA